MKLSVPHFMIRCHRDRRTDGGHMLVELPGGKAGALAFSSRDTAEPHIVRCRPIYPTCVVSYRGCEELAALLDSPDYRAHCQFIMRDMDHHNPTCVMAARIDDVLAALAADGDDAEAEFEAIPINGRVARGDYDATL